MSEAGFEPADYSTKWQHPTIRSSPGGFEYESCELICKKGSLIFLYDFTARLQGLLYNLFPDGYVSSLLFTIGYPQYF